MLGLPPPRPAPDTCPRCGGPRRRGTTECWCCRHVGRALGEGPASGARLVPARLCRPGDALHSALRRYKDAPAVSAREHYSALLASLLEEFLAVHGACVRRALGGWEALSTVPSSGRGGGARPFDTVVAEVPALREAEVVELTVGSARARHLAPAAGAFLAPRGVAGRRVLVLDDTWVTGARARSAVAALEQGGAEVAGVLAIGRSVDPEAAPARARQWWERQVAHSGDRRCGLVSCAAAGGMPVAS